MTIDSGDLNSQRFTVTFTSNAASAAGDSVRMYYTSNCGNSLRKSAKLSNTALLAPAAATAVTITALQTNVCSARKYRFAAPNLPAATTTTGAASGYVWDVIGSLSSTMTIDSGDLYGQRFTVTFTSNAASAAGDSVRVFYTTAGCGNSKAKASKLTNTRISAPAAPTAITITALQTNVCGARRYRYMAPVLPNATTTTGSATGYIWSLIGTLASTVTIDSGSLTSRTFIATYTSNAAAGIGDSIRVLYTSDCGNSLRKASKLSNTALGVPLAPASITIQQVLPDVCGARVYRYIAPALPPATTTAGAASAYLWTSPTGNVGSTFTLDSGSTSGRVIRYRYASNAEATIDSIRVRYTSGCGNGAIKAQKLSNLAKVCLLNSEVFSSRAAISQNQTNSTFVIYPNPNKGDFKISLGSKLVKSEKMRIEIYDAKGNCITKINYLIKAGEIEKQITIDNLTNGLYFINYTLGNQTGIERFVILR
jgi:peroxiredoxin family protein